MVNLDVQLPIKVALFGMDERSISRMATIFKVVFKSRCELAQGDEANLSILDLDGESNIWEKYQSLHPGLPAIIMSEAPVELDGAIYVAKPAKLDQLWNSIFSLVTGFPLNATTLSATSSATSPTDNEIKAKSVASQKPEKAQTDKPQTDKPQIDKPQTDKSGMSKAAGAMDAQLKENNTGAKVSQGKGNDTAAIYFNPDDYLLGQIVRSLKDAKGKDCAIHVQAWSGRRLVILPEKGLVYTDLTDSQLKNLGVATLNEDFVVDIETKYGADMDKLAPNDSAGLQTLSIEYFLWDLTLRTARGRVPEGSDLSKPCYLQCWPNFPRLPRTPHAMRIASLWVNSPRTLDDVSANLGIPASDVYSFYSAAHMIGLAGPARRQEDNLVAPRDVVKEGSLKRGLLSAILRHIGK